MSRHLQPLGSVLVIVVAAWASRPCSADMIVLAGGEVRVGRITSEESAAVRLVTGSTSRKREVTIRRGEILRIYRGSEEAEQISKCEDASSLKRWTAGYFHSGLEDLASLCLQRALDLDASIGAKPKRKSQKVKKPKTQKGETSKQGTEAFNLFWNQAVLRRRAAAVSRQDASGMLKVAKWAREAGLADEARRYLRQAWQVDRESTEIASLAAQWGARLEPWIRLDLTPALETPLLSDAIQDEGVMVAAQPGMVFLTLPLRYDPDAGPKTLSKSSFRGRDMRGFYGLRCPPVHKGSLQLATFSEQEPIYERLELKGDDEGKRRKVETSKRRKARTFEVIAKNNVGPRRFDGKTTKRDRPKQRTRTFRSSGWAALIVEIPESTTHLTFGWVDRGGRDLPGELHGGEEELDLDFLRSVGDRLRIGGDAAATRADLMPPAVSAIVKKLTGESSATAALAIGRLERLRDDVRGLHLGGVSGAAPDWMAQVDAAVITAGSRPEEDVRRAAWWYFASRPSVPKAAVAFLGRQSAQVQREWIALIERELFVDEDREAPRKDSRPIVEEVTRRRTGGGRSGAGPIRAEVSVAAGLLGGILHSDDTFVCKAALDVLLAVGERFGEQVDWGLAEHGSETSQSLVVSRLEAITDEASARRLLRALMKDVRPAIAGKIADHARRLNVRIRSPNDALLKQWSSMDDPAGQAGLLTVLEAVSLGDLVYSQRFADIIKEATADEADEMVREAAFRMLVHHGRLRIEDLSAISDQLSATNVRGGNFPVLVKTEARDPLVNGLARAARTSGSRQVRVEALAVLALMGYAEEAAQSLATGAKDDAERVALLKQLVASSEEAARCDGLLAMFGYLLRREYASSAELIMSRLPDIWTSSPSQQWRLLAAVKAGVDFEELSRLCTASDPQTADKATRWLRHLGHMTTQDEQRLAASLDVEERMQRLKWVDFRRGYLVDGHYGALAVLETVVAQGWPEQAGRVDPRYGHYRWSAPQRLTVVLPRLQLETSDEDDSYQVRWGDHHLGHGLLKSREQILPPSRYSPRLEDADERFLGVDGWGWPDPMNPAKLSQAAVGPVMLPDRVVSAGAAPGTMTLDISEYLRTALREQQTFGKADLEELVPEPYKITVRYAAFGSFYGVGQRRPLPGGKVTAGQRHLLNVMLVLERID